MQGEKSTFDGGPALSLALGCFGIALGTAELLAPRWIARLIGVHADGRATAILRTCGARGIVTGLGILAQPARPVWVWSRVGGDALDLTTLGRAADDDRANHARLLCATMTALGITALDVMTARSLSPREDGVDEFGFSLAHEQAATIGLPLDAVESAWDTWCASAHAAVRNGYAVRFEPAPGARGTEVHLAGGGSRSFIREELRRFKQWAETGEIAVSDGPGLRRAAQPAGDPHTQKVTEVLR